MINQGYCIKDGKCWACSPAPSSRGQDI